MQLKTYLFRALELVNPNILVRCRLFFGGFKLVDYSYLDDNL